MGKTDDALGYLEEARTIQERGAAAPEQLSTYLSLARLYQRKGDKDEARTILNTAFDRFGTTTELERALKSLGD